MTNEIVINASVGETRVGIIERNLFTELHIERDDERNVAGAVVKGRVTRVLPGMQAAFRGHRPRESGVPLRRRLLRQLDQIEWRQRGSGAQQRSLAQRQPAAAAEYRHPAPRRPGDRRPDRQGADRQQGRSDHLPHFNRGSPPGGHAAFAAGGRVPAHRVRSRAAPTPRDRFAKTGRTISASSSELPATKRARRIWKPTSVT